MPGTVVTEAVTATAVFVGAAVLLGDGVVAGGAGTLAVGCAVAGSSNIHKAAAMAEVIKAAGSTRLIGELRNLSGFGTVNFSDLSALDYRMKLNHGRNSLRRRRNAAMPQFLNVARQQL